MKRACVLLCTCLAHGMETAERLRLRSVVKEMFYHAYNSYRELAFPHDELKPISGTWTDSLIELGNAVRINREGYHGVAMTLIDSMDTLAVFGNVSEFTWAVKWVSRNIDFNKDIVVNVFETNIRILGGLLSAHLLAAGQCPGAEEFGVHGYDGKLLQLAHDLGRRLLVAFDATKSGLPHVFVNLRHGIASGTPSEQCTAGVGTMLLEFGLLSRLTGDPSFETAAMRALGRLWAQRSNVGLLGNTIDVHTGHWKNTHAGIGAGIDSFYEYLVKGYVLLGRPELFSMFNTSYLAVLKHLKKGAWYTQANMHDGSATHQMFESLQAFWPALQVSVGDVEIAAETHLATHGLWSRFQVLPERYDYQHQQVHSTLANYPLRPEHIESTHALHEATRQAKYLRMGKDFIASLESATRTPHGFAGVRNVRTMEKEDHMPSFFLAETLKYLYLLFDADNWLNKNSSRYIFSTEGHPLPLSMEMDYTCSGPDCPPQMARSAVNRKQLVAQAKLGHQAAAATPAPAQCKAPSASSPPAAPPQATETVEKVQVANGQPMMVGPVQVHTDHRCVNLKGEEEETLETKLVPSQEGEEYRMSVVHMSSDGSYNQWILDGGTLHRQTASHTMHLLQRHQRRWLGRCDAQLIGMPPEDVHRRWRQQGQLSGQVKSKHSACQANWGHRFKDTIVAVMPEEGNVECSELTLARHAHNAGAMALVVPHQLHCSSDRSFASNTLHCDTDESGIHCNRKQKGGQGGTSGQPQRQEPCANVYDCRKEKATASRADLLHNTDLENNPLATLSNGEPIMPLPVFRISQRSLNGILTTLPKSVLDAELVLAEAKGGGATKEAELPKGMALHPTGASSFHFEAIGGWAVDIRHNGEEHLQVTVQAPGGATGDQETTEGMGRAAQRAAVQQQWVKQEDLKNPSCHVEDRLPDHSCKSNKDCGISGEACRQRLCSNFGYCSTPKQ